MKHGIASRSGWAVFKFVFWTGFRVVFHTIRISRAIVGKGMNTVVRRKGIVWDLDLRETIDFWIYLTGAFQHSTVNAVVRLIRPGDTVLDIGANIGAMALFAAKTVGPNGRVICFEPTQMAKGKLLRNLDLNPELRGRVEVHQVELVDTPGRAPSTLNFASWPIQAASGRHPGHHGVAAESSGATAITLDEFCEQKGIDRIDVVKLDVDGNECGVLRGARRVLKQFRPRMVIELQPCVFGQTAPDRFEDFIELLRESGYALQDEISGEALPVDPAGLRAIIPSDKAINAIASPLKPSAAFAGNLA